MGDDRVKSFGKMVVLGIVYVVLAPFALAGAAIALMLAAAIAGAIFVLGLLGEILGD